MQNPRPPFTRHRDRHRAILLDGIDIFTEESWSTGGQYLGGKKQLSKVKFLFLCGESTTNIEGVTYISVDSFIRCTDQYLDDHSYYAIAAMPIFCVTASAENTAFLSFCWKFRRHDHQEEVDHANQSINYSDLTIHVTGQDRKGKPLEGLRFSWSLITFYISAT